MWHPLSAKKFALTSLRNGIRSVGIVRLRTEATEIFFNGLAQYGQRNKKQGKYFWSRQGQRLSVALHIRTAGRLQTSGHETSMFTPGRTHPSC
jgi:hypothetical protein